MTRNPWPAVLAVLAGCWIVAVAAGTQTLTWLVQQVLEASGLALPGWVWPATAWLAAALIGGPALLLARLPRSVAIRRTGRAWVAAAVSLGLLGSLRAIPILHHELYLALLAVAAGGLAVLVTRVEATHSRGDGPAPALLGLAVGIACLLPWAWLGALGSLPETVLALAAAAAIGWLAAAVLGGRFWAAHAGVDGESATGRRAHLVLVGGPAAGVALAPIAAGTGAGGAFLASQLVLPALGFAAAALQPLASGRSPWPVRLAVGGAAIGPLAFVDPEETSLLLNFGTFDVGFWMSIAALAGLCIAMVAGIITALSLVRSGRPVRARPVRTAAAAAVVALVAAGAGAVYATVGQPGSHGDRLFVVLAEQADLTGLAGIPDRGARLRATYDRLVSHAERTQGALRRELDRWRLRHTPYYLVNGLEVDGGPAVRAWLSRRSDVDRVLISPRLRPLPARPSMGQGGRAAPESPEWNITQLRADRAWAAGVTGHGIVVGTSDSGVDGAHPALHNGFRGGDDSWFDPWNHSRTPIDHGRHGTHTLGSAVGGAGIGVAPGAQWVGCVNLDRNYGNPARYLDCLQFLLAPFPHGGDPMRDGRPDRAPHILTNSWGCPELEGCDPPALRPATAALAAAGIFVVAAAGNTGPFCGSVDDPPAPYPDVLTVGAIDSAGQVAGFSSRGPAPDGASKPDLVAPGVEILSARPGGGYGRETGTSMATPHVAGVVALMWSANPALVGDIASTRRLLLETAAPAGGEASGQDCGPANLHGAGVVDALAAVQAAQRHR